MFGPALLTDLFAPFEGRFARAAEIAFAVMMVTIVSMAYQIPEPAISVYLIFFVAKENSGLNIVMSLALIVVITLVVAMSIGLAILTLNAPEGRVVVLACVAFASFFLGASSKLAPLASTIGLVIAYVLDLLGSSPLGEIAVRGLLYAWLFAVMPMLVFIFYNVFFGRHPEILARRAIAERLRLAAGVFREGQGASLEALRADLEKGDVESAKQLKMVRLWRRLPAATIERLGELSGLSYGLAMTVVAMMTLKPPPAAPDEVSARLESLAHRIERLPRVIPPREDDQARRAAPSELSDQIVALTARMEDVVAGGPVERRDKAEPEDEKKKGGFFVPDAFSNPVYARFALKGAAAAMICYLTYTLLDWPGIHTAMLTCFIISLTTVGETMQKLFLRISGCLVGAVIGTLSMVTILPGTTSITALVAFVGLVTLPAAWIAVGKPTVSYIGFQMAFAFFLCVLQGAEPKFDLTVARDRTIGILLGDLVVYVIFTRIFPVSALGQLRLDLDRLLGQCRDVLKTMAAPDPAIGATEEAARAFATLEAVSGDLAAYGYETIRSGNALLLARANRLAIRALKNLVRAVGVVSAFPQPSGEGANPEALSQLYAKADARLETLAASLSTPFDGSFSKVAGSMTPAPAPDAARTPQIGALEALMARLNQVQLTLFHYRRLLEPKAGAYE
jgi:multidrug resistance protein MdtO